MEQRPQASRAERARWRRPRPPLVRRGRATRTAARQAVAPLRRSLRQRFRDGRRRRRRKTAQAPRRERTDRAGRSARRSREWARDDAWIGTREACGEDFDQQSRADPFIAASRRHRAPQRFGRIDGRVARRVEGPTFRNRLAGPRALHHFTLGHDARALIDDEPRAAGAVWNGERPRIGAERGLAAAPRRDRGRRVGEPQRDEAGSRQPLGVVAQSAAIIGVADREARDALRARVR